jgi:pyrimidine and pyridine-specific 5'-nucleotidase
VSKHYVHFRLLAADVPLDDSFINTEAAHARGWHAAHLLDETDPEPPKKAAEHQIRSLQELRNIFPQFFKSSS